MRNERPVTQCYKREALCLHLASTQAPPLSNITKRNRRIRNRNSFIHREHFTGRHTTFLVCSSNSDYGFLTPLGGSIDPARRPETPSYLQLIELEPRRRPKCRRSRSRNPEGIRLRLSGPRMLVGHCGPQRFKVEMISLCGQRTTTRHVRYGGVVAPPYHGLGWLNRGKEEGGVSLGGD